MLSNRSLFIIIIFILLLRLLFVSNRRKKNAISAVYVYVQSHVKILLVIFHFMVIQPANNRSDCRAKKRLSKGFLFLSYLKDFLNILCDAHHRHTHIYIICDFIIILNPILALAKLSLELRVQTFVKSYIKIIFYVMIDIDSNHIEVYFEQSAKM